MTVIREVEVTDHELRSRRLVLRPWRPDDVAEIVAALQSPAMRRFLALPDPYTEAEATKFVAHARRAEPGNGMGMECAVIERDSARLVGSASLRPPVDRAAADIGYWIVPSAQGNGYASEVTKTLARRAFEHGVHRVELRLDPTNLASARVALRSGFGFEAIRRDAHSHRDGLSDLAVFVRTMDDPGDPIPPAFPALPAGESTDGTVSIRGMLPSDVDGFIEQEADERTKQVGFTGRTPTRRTVQRLLARAGLDLLVGQVAGFTIVDVPTGAFAGSLRVRCAGPPDVGGIGYAVHPAFRGRGYTSRALRLLIPWAFELADFARLELGAKIDNVASQRAALTAGFESDGIWRSRLRNADGTFSDEARFCLINPRCG